jgi:hypothetical protein
MGQSRTEEGDAAAPPAGPGVDRRTFLTTGAAAFAAFSSGYAWIVTPAAGAEAPDAEAFRALSQFLTGADQLDPVQAERAFAQLAALDDNFPEKAATLNEAVTNSGAQSVDAFLAHPSSDGDLRTTTTAIVSAWYLGYTGTPISLRAEDDTEFVTFTGALMFEPTIDATVRPTYVRAGLNYWMEPPDFVTAPPMLPGMKSWGRESPQGIGTIPVTPAPAGEEPIPLPPKGAGP